MYILLNGENGRDMVDRLKGVFGIQSFSPVVKTGKELEEIKEWH